MKLNSTLEVKIKLSKRISQMIFKRNEKDSITEWLALIFSKPSTSWANLIYDLSIFFWYFPLFFKPTFHKIFTWFWSLYILFETLYLFIPLSRKFLLNKIKQINCYRPSLEWCRNKQKSLNIKFLLYPW